MLSNTIDLPSTCVCVHAQSCLTLCNPMNCSLPSSSVHGIFQARILEWVAISSSRASYSPRVEPMSPALPALAGGFFTAEPSGKHPLLSTVHLLFLDLPQLPFILYSISLTFTIRKHGEKLWHCRETLTFFFSSEAISSSWDFEISQGKDKTFPRFPVSGRKHNFPSTLLGSWLRPLL